MGREALRPRGRQIEVAADGSVEHALQTPAQRVQRVYPPLRVQYPHGAAGRDAGAHGSGVGEAFAAAVERLAPARLAPPRHVHVQPVAQPPPGEQRKHVVSRTEAGEVGGRRPEQRKCVFPPVPAEQPLQRQRREEVAQNRPRRVVVEAGVHQRGQRGGTAPPRSSEQRWRAWAPPPLSAASWRHRRVRELRRTTTGALKILSESELPS